MAKRTRRKQSADRRQQLTNNIACGLHRAALNLSLNDIRKHLAEYDGIDADQLRRNFIAFREEVAPYAQNLGLLLCCHPDDPPFPLLGLPRIMSTEADYDCLTSHILFQCLHI